MRLIRILLGVVVVLVLGLVALVVLLPGVKIAKIAADQVEAQTGRALTFDGDVNLSFFPVLGVSTGPVALANADWSEEGSMFKAEAAQIGVDAMGLLSGDIRIKRIALTAPDVVLEQRADGRANWDLMGAGGAEATASEPGADSGAPAFVLDQLEVTGARLRYLAEGADPVVIEDLDAALRWGGGAANLEMTVTLAEDPVAVTAEIGDLEALLAGELSLLKADVTAAGNSVSFDGRAGITPEVAGRIKLDLPQPGAFMAALGQGAADIPATKLSGDVTYMADGAASLRSGQLVLAGNALSIEADMTPGGTAADRPKITANLAGDQLDLTSFMGSDSGGEDAGSAASGWSKAPIDASALGLFDAEIALSANGVDTGTLKFGATRLGVTVDRARAVLTLSQLQGYDGAISGQLVANNRSGLSVGGSLNMAGVAMQSLMKDLADFDRLSGSADLALNFLGSGGSLHAIMNSLSGDGSLAIGQGTLSGIDLDQLLRGSTGGGTTVFDNLSASWTIAGGVLSNEDLRAELPSFLATGAGTIGIGAQVIDYTFTPQLRNDAEDGLAVPVRIKGPWASPKIWPDLEAAVKQNFKEEVKALEEKAKDEVSEKLGVERQEGESVEDALERKLEEEVKDRLKGLLGGN